MAVVRLTTDDFDDRIKQGLVMVDFWAEWCGPCKMAGPVIDQLSVDYAGKVVVAKVDVDTHPDLAARYGVMSIPTVVLFKDGKELGRKIGFAGRQMYVDLLTLGGVV